MIVDYSRKNHAIHIGNNDDTSRHVRELSIMQWWLSIDQIRIDQNIDQNVSDRSERNTTNEQYKLECTRWNYIDCERICLIIFSEKFFQYV